MLATGGGSGSPRLSPLLSAASSSSTFFFELHPKAAMATARRIASAKPDLASPHAIRGRFTQAPAPRMEFFFIVVSIEQSLRPAARMDSNRKIGLKPLLIYAQARTRLNWCAIPRTDRDR